MIGFLKDFILKESKDTKLSSTFLGQLFEKKSSLHRHVHSFKQDNDNIVSLDYVLRFSPQWRI